MDMLSITSLISLSAGCLAAGVCFGVIFERRSINVEWQRWWTLSQRVGDLEEITSDAWNEANDRMKRIEDEVAYTQNLYFEEYSELDLEDDITLEEDTALDLPIVAGSSD
jgi:hypothetical protein